MKYAGHTRPGTKVNGKPVKKPYAKTREAALLIRNDMYKPDEPCDNGHHSLRRVKSGRCKTCETLKLI
jgi:hypothetical protein